MSLIHRPRRLRRTASIRALVRETTLSPKDFIYPIFVDETLDQRRPVVSMPGVDRIPLSEVAQTARDVHALGIPGIILFGIPKQKDAIGSEAWNDQGIVQCAIREAKNAVAELTVIADSCFCEYTDHGHCGVLDGHEVNNDLTLSNLQKEVVSYADAGVDIIAPSGMMDGMVSAIRQGLDQAGHVDIPIMSYAVKYSSAYYGPFRDAADSAPSFGDRRSYQMDPGNSREALREAKLDIAQGSDMLMVKPALSYMDIIRSVKELSDLPLAVYNVSGEYAMIKAAAERGWIDEQAVVLETMTSFKRAGADMILSYHALDVARWLDQ